MAKAASRERGRAGERSVTQLVWPMSAAPGGAPDQSEARRSVNAMKGGREKGSPGVKLKLKPERYKEVSGGWGVGCVFGFQLGIILAS